GESVHRSDVDEQVELPPQRVVDARVRDIPAAAAPDDPAGALRGAERRLQHGVGVPEDLERAIGKRIAVRGHRGGACLHEGEGEVAPRSEEHTSELQSRENLVCRLLLEKKNICKYSLARDDSY